MVGSSTAVPGLRHRHLTARTHAAELLDTLLGCPVSEVARLGRTLAIWRKQYLTRFDTDRASDGPTEAVNLGVALA